MKSISEQTLDLKGASVIITGKNNSGKSTLINLVWDRLVGIIPPVAIKRGETDGVGVIELTTGEKFTYEAREGKSDKITFTTREGIAVPSVREISRKFFPEKFCFIFYLCVP